MAFTLLLFPVLFAYFDKKEENKDSLYVKKTSKACLRDVKNFSAMYWILCACGVMGLSGFYSFYFNSASLLGFNYNFERVEVG